MRKKDFSEISTLLKNNGVGFIDLFFRSNVRLNPKVIDSKQEITFKFSNGADYLGSIKVSPKDHLEFLHYDKKGFTKEIDSRTFCPKSTNQKVSFHFSKISSLNSFSFGECRIILY